MVPNVQNMNPCTSHYGSVLFTVTALALEPIFSPFCLLHMARREGVETGPLRFMSGPQSSFCLASGFFAWTGWFLGALLRPPPTHHSTNDRHSWSTAVICACKWLESNFKSARRRKARPEPWRSGCVVDFLSPVKATAVLYTTTYSLLPCPPKMTKICRWK